MVPPAPVAGWKYSAYRILSGFAALFPSTKAALHPHLPVARVNTQGHPFVVTPTDNLCEYKMWKYKRILEPQSVALLQQEVRGKRALMYDLGANIGIFSVLIGEKMGPGSRILCFEPNPEMAARLAGNLDLNNAGKIARIHQVALGPEAGEGNLSLDGKNLGASTLLGAGLDQNGAFKGLIRVPIRPLAEYVDTATNYDVVVMKVDIEGFEDQALLPFFDSVDAAFWPDAILIETMHAHVWKTDLVAELAGRGYAIVATPEHNTFFRRAPGAAQAAKRSLSQRK